ncbi:MAG: DMT family transporter, partial [Paracoccaceae bacterium]
MTQPASPQPLSPQPNTQTRGIWLMIATTLVFALQDGVTRSLTDLIPVPLIVMVRYWFFALFVLALAARATGGIRARARSRAPVLQISRGIVLALEVTVMGLAFQMLGLVESHAVFACYPLVVAALSGPVLGERVGWRRWSAIAIGFVGVLVILQPGYGVLSPWAGLPMAAAMLFALYSLLTRRVARYDSAATSFFWTAIVGAICMTLTGLSTWQPIPPAAWGGLLALCLLAVLGHYMLIQSYAQAEASTVQPFAYF